MFTLEPNQRHSGSSSHHGSTF
ncbi:hypothetical protein CABS01_13155 [Colletotrichum abscissum]|nr:hypothetical protein CABS01_13155 [Colletotrichum abscissum]